MTMTLGQRRRAERFAQLLDEASGGRRQHLRTPLDEELAGLVSLRHELVDTAPAPELGPEFRTGLRAMLVAAAEREGIGATAQPERATARPEPAALVRAGARGPRARTAVVAGVAVGAVAFASMSTASENAVPGDALYGVKRSTERAQLALASSDVGRGQLYLDFARTRLREARTLTGDLGRVLDDMDRDTTQGVWLLTTAATNRQDRTALAVIDGFVEEQRTALTDLADRASGGDRARVTTSLDLLDTVEERSAGLRDDLDQNCSSPAASGYDTLGPTPDECVALPTPDALPPATGHTDRPADPTGSPPDPAAPPAEPGGTTEQPEPAATPAGEPAPPAAAGPSDQAEPKAAEPEPDPADSGTTDDSGLLDSLNRLLGNLLGK